MSTCLYVHIHVYICIASFVLVLKVSMADSIKKLEVSVEIKKVPRPPRRRVLQRVPALLRENEKQKYIYDPMVVPLGPYHHGRLPEYDVAEQLKEELLDMVCGDRDRGVPLGLVRERVAEIRQFYGGADGYGDEELAAMMLRDTCFVLCCVNLKLSKHMSVILECLGYSGSAFVKRDLYMLENQIPLWLISLLIPFAFHDDDVDVDVELKVSEFLSKIIPTISRRQRSSRGERDKERRSLSTFSKLRTTRSFTWLRQIIIPIVSHRKIN